MSNKLILELELPTNLEDKELASAFISKQVEYTIQVLKDSLSYFKGEGVEVPSLSIRGLTKNKKSVDTEFNPFKTKLLDWVLKYQPKLDVAPQIKVIKELYALGKPAEEWIGLFEASRLEYALTTWYTVKYRLGKTKGKEPEQQFARKEMDETEVESLKERLKKYSASEE